MDNWVAHSGMLLYLHHRNSKLFFHPTKYLNLSYTVLNLLYSGCDHVHCILKTVKYVWLCSNMPIYKIKSHFGPCSKICDNIYNILSVIKKRFASRWVRHQSNVWVSKFRSSIVVYYTTVLLQNLLNHTLGSCKCKKNPKLNELIYVLNFGSLFSKCKQIKCFKKETKGWFEILSKTAYFCHFMNQIRRQSLHHFSQTRKSMVLII